MESLRRYPPLKSNEDTSDEALAEKWAKFCDVDELPIKPRSKSVPRKKLNDYKTKKVIRKRSRTTSKVRPFLLNGQYHCDRIPCNSSSQIPCSKIDSQHEIKRDKQAIANIFPENQPDCTSNNVKLNCCENMKPFLTGFDQSELNCEYFRKSRIHHALISDDGQHFAENELNTAHRNINNIKDEILSKEPNTGIDEYANAEDVGLTVGSIILSINNFFVWLCKCIALPVFIYVVTVKMMEIWKIEPKEHEILVDGRGMLETLKDKVINAWHFTKEEVKSANTRNR